MIHFCPDEMTVVMMVANYLTTTYHYYVCRFKIRFLGAEEHDLSDHFPDKE